MTDLKIARPYPELEDLDFKSAGLDWQGHLMAKIEALCERAKAKGPGWRLAIGSLEQDPKTFGWRIPYAFIEDPAQPVAFYWQVFGPWPEANAPG